ncbi:MAG TPA: hypothetical protein VLH56_19425 [Dissulfurispiraceae bacterium]|nr:hypothetical protein [Dissulfurispiraceae bacterium]
MDPFFVWAIWLGITFAVSVVLTLVFAAIAGLKESALAMMAAIIMPFVAWACGLGAIICVIAGVVRVLLRG